MAEYLADALAERDTARAEVRTLQAKLRDARANVGNWCAEAQEWRLRFEAATTPTTPLPEVRLAVFPEFTGALQVFAHAQP